MTRDERHRWLFANMDGWRIHFSQKGMPVVYDSVPFYYQKKAETK